MSGRFIATAGTGWEYSDDDGVTWSSTQAGPLNGGAANIRSVAYASETKTWVMAGDGGRVATSADGSSFSQVASDIFGAGEHVQVAVWCPGLGSGTWLFGGSSGSWASSTDLSSFSDLGASGLSAINDGCWSSSLGMACFVGIKAGSSGVATSTDGSSISSSSITGIGTALNCVAWADTPGVFVTGTAFSNYGTSSDGSTWTKRTQSPSAVSEIFEVAWDADNGLVVIVGQSGGIGTTSTPTNATSWTSRTSNSGGATLRAVIRGDTTTVTVGDSAKISTSADDATWVARTSHFAGGIGDVAWGQLAGGVKVRGYLIYY